METYYVNIQELLSGDHEVHASTCAFLPPIELRLYLGRFSNCTEAVEEAKKIYRQSKGCYTCCKDSQTL